MVDELAFDWDDANISHIARHDISPGEAEEVVKNDPLDLGVDTVNGEERFLSVGLTNGGRLLTVVTTIRRGRVRVATAYPAPRPMAVLYFRMRGV